MIEEKNRKNRLCPYLGQKSDPGTAYYYPFVENRCYHSKRVAAIDLGHQEEFCLTTMYPNCKEYAADPDAALPVALHGFSGKGSWKNRRKNWLVWAIVVEVLGIVAAWWLITRGGGFNLFPGIPTEIIGSTATGLMIPVTGLSKTVTPFPTPAPTITDTATSRPALGLETPLGIDRKFVIVQVQEGDSLERIAGKHGTTVAAMTACNYRLPIPLVPGWAIVVPLNIVDVRGFPAFEAYQISEEISLEDLATRLSVGLDELKYYNGLEDHFIARAGDWLLVPRTGSPTP